MFFELSLFFVLLFFSICLFSNKVKTKEQTTHETKKTPPQTPDLRSDPGRSGKLQDREAIHPQHANGGTENQHPQPVAKRNITIGEENYRYSKNLRACASDMLRPIPFGNTSTSLRVISGPPCFISINILYESSLHPCFP